MIGVRCCVVLGVVRVRVHGAVVVVAVLVHEVHRQQQLVVVEDRDDRVHVMELEEIGVTDVFFELFDATHMAIEYRYPLGVKYLAERLSG